MTLTMVGIGHVSRLNSRCVPVNLSCINQQFILKYRKQTSCQANELVSEITASVCDSRMLLAQTSVPSY